MRPKKRTFLSRSLLALGMIFISAVAAVAQAPQPVCTLNAPPPTKDDPAPPDAKGGIRIEVKGPDGKPLERKRFFLLERDLSKDSSFKPESAPKRDDFLTGASPELRAWLKKFQCDTLYCPEYEAGYEEAVKTVPEFKKAYDEGLRKYQNPKIALSWITVNFPLKNVRTEFYDRKTAWIEQAAQKGGKVMSVMTDEEGVAYFTDVKLGTYYMTNLTPLEESNVLWNCEVKVPPPLPRQLYSISFNLSASKAAAK